MPGQNATINMKCSRCLKSSSLSEMSYAKDGKSLICHACANPSPLPPMKARNVGGPERTKGGATYRCESCNFEFQRKNLTPTKCPYCSKTGVVLVAADKRATGFADVDDDF